MREPLDDCDAFGDALDLDVGVFVEADDAGGFDDEDFRRGGGWLSWRLVFK